MANFNYSSTPTPGIITNLLIKQVSANAGPATCTNYYFSFSIPNDIPAGGCIKINLANQFSGNVDPQDLYIYYSDRIEGKL